MISFSVNGQAHEIDVEPEMPLLWVLRDLLNLTGTKFGCGVGLCGACTVHIDGEATRSCLQQIGEIAGRRVTTIEGLGAGQRHPVQEAWIAEQTPQCGYCQSGMIMAAAALLRTVASPTDEQINDAVTNMCRCGTYARVRSAIHKAAQA